MNFKNMIMNLITGVTIQIEIVYSNTSNYSSLILCECNFYNYSYVKKCTPPFVHAMFGTTEIDVFNN